MKELITSIIQIIGAVVVTLLILVPGFLYTIGYGIWLKKRGSNWSTLFRFIWRIIDGSLASVAHFLGAFAYALDLLWNVLCGEMIEDFITSKEDTEFTKKNTTVSATVGKLEIDNNLNKTGVLLSKVLNIAFWQSQHAKDAWLYLQARLNLKEQYFNKR